MAKDYFQDIVPPARGSGAEAPRKVPIQPAARTESAEPHDPSPEAPAAENIPDTPSDRSIRNVSINPARPRRPMGDVTPPGNFGMRQGSRRGGKRWLWLTAGASLIIVAVLLLMALRSTSVSVIPKTHAVVFDQSSEFTAYPAVAASSGTLPYTIQAVDIEDSGVVPSTGTVRADEKASGLITVFNDYSSAPVKLIKNTRFATPEGLIYRAPADIVVPGKSGTSAGKISVTVVADQPGAQYNVGPIAKFTLPGLKGGDMYAKVYASSDAAFAGGFSGERPGVAQSDMDKTLADIRSRLEGKARDAVRGVQTDSDVVFTDLVQIQYVDQPSTPEAGGKVRIHQKAHVVIPVFPASDLAKAVARAVSSASDDARVTLLGGEGYGAHIQSSTSTLGTDAMTFTLLGQATIVWDIDTAALAAALAGRDQDAFESIVTGFPGIQEAHARIEPFWSRSFPKDPGDIKIRVEKPSK